LEQEYGAPSFAGGMHSQMGLLLASVSQLELLLLWLLA
jgi:hypothetical protein